MDTTRISNTFVAENSTAATVPGVEINTSTAVNTGGDTISAVATDIASSTTAAGNNGDTAAADMASALAESEQINEFLSRAISSSFC